MKSIEQSSLNISESAFMSDLAKYVTRKETEGIHGYIKRINGTCDDSKTRSAIITRYYLEQGTKLYKFYGEVDGKEHSAIILTRKPILDKSSNELAMQELVGTPHIEAFDDVDFNNYVLSHAFIGNPRMQLTTIHGTKSLDYYSENGELMASKIGGDYFQQPTTVDDTIKRICHQGFSEDAKGIFYLAKHFDQRIGKNR